MNIQINGEKEALSADALTVSQLLTLKEVKMPDMVSVELNGDIVDRDAFDTTPVSDGDEVEFLYFMGGGQFA
jgi:sulfur carrier protein